jgi:hypothetical protein
VKAERDRRLANEYSLDEFGGRSSIPESTSRVRSGMDLVSMGAAVYRSVRVVRKMANT